jgi:hypothetical protein
MEHIRTALALLASYLRCVKVLELGTKIVSASTSNHMKNAIPVSYMVRRIFSSVSH